MAFIISSVQPQAKTDRTISNVLVPEQAEAFLALLP